MSQPAIRVEGLSKEYVLGASAQESEGFRELVWNSMTAPIRRLRQAHGDGAQEQRFWALKDVTFDVVPGEVVGIIGRNGAGKSTLLKILSRITEPTKGRVELKGRIASLLEVGTGFHPELTGRENIFLNGSILGMSRREVQRRFDEIVAFAEVETFLDTPVKRYSSGMYTRLAFAVAAHLEPEILMVDEVLAVGDAAFQAKCFGSMRRIARDGRTVLFVSHNMRAIADLASRAVLIDQGAVLAEGGARQVVSQYLGRGNTDTLEWRPRPAPEVAFEFHSVRIETTRREGDVVAYDAPFDVVLDYTVRGRLRPGRHAIRIDDAEGRAVFSSSDTDDVSSLNRPWPAGRQTARCTVPGRLLMPGRYSLSVVEPQPDELGVIHESIAVFTVGAFGSPSERDGRAGAIAPILRWTCELNSA